MKTQRPDKKSVTAVINEITVLKNGLRNISESETAVKHAISERANCMRQNTAFTELALIDVDVLNADKQGIRVSALKSAGIHNMSQLCQMSKHAITNVSGIGEQTATKIKSIADKMYNAVISSAKIQINTEKKTATQDAVVQNLFILRNVEEIKIKAQNILSQEQNLDAALENAARRATAPGPVRRGDPWPAAESSCARCRTIRAGRRHWRRRRARQPPRADTGTSSHAAGPERPGRRPPGT